MAHGSTCRVLPLVAEPDRGAVDRWPPRCWRRPVRGRRSTARGRRAGPGRGRRRRRGAWRARRRPARPGVADSHTVAASPRAAVSAESNSIAGSSKSLRRIAVADLVGEQRVVAAGLHRHPHRPQLVLVPLEGALEGRVGEVVVALDDLPDLALLDEPSGHEQADRQVHDPFGFARRHVVDVTGSAWMKRGGSRWAQGGMSERTVRAESHRLRCTSATCAPPCWPGCSPAATGREFRLRIEDLDTAARRRRRRGRRGSRCADLAALGLDFDGEVVWQSDRPATPTPQRRPAGHLRVLLHPQGDRGGALCAAR